jgi:hypothetical protein
MKHFRNFAHKQTINEAKKQQYKDELINELL